MVAADEARAPEPSPALGNLMSQFPRTVLFRPEMGRAKLFAQPHKFLRVHSNIFHDLAKIPGRCLAVELAYQRHALFPSQVPVADFLRGVVGRATQPILNICRVVVQVVDLVVDAVVLAVRAPPYDTVAPGNRCVPRRSNTPPAASTSGSSQGNAPRSGSAPVRGGRRADTPLRRPSQRSYSASSLRKGIPASHMSSR